jgi:hypothetical protein
MRGQYESDSRWEKVESHRGKRWLSLLTQPTTHAATGWWESITVIAVSTNRFAEFAD